jgi:hypothetical protein
MNELIKAEAIDKGICCNSCQETILGGCNQCHEGFRDGTKIYCEHHSRSDCVHYCSDCGKKKMKVKK